MLFVVFLRLSQGFDGLHWLFTVVDTFLIYVAKWPFSGAKWLPWQRVRQSKSKRVRQSMSKGKTSPSREAAGHVKWFP